VVLDHLAEVRSNGGLAYDLRNSLEACAEVFHKVRMSLSFLKVFPILQDSSAPEYFEISCSNEVRKKPVGSSI